MSWLTNALPVLFRVPQAQEMQYYDEQTYETIEVPQTYNETYTEMVAVVREAVPVPVKKKVMQKSWKYIHTRKVNHKYQRKLTRRKWLI